MTPAVPNPTFRDPAGSLSFEDNEVVRKINSLARSSVLEFLDTSLCKRMQHCGDLIAATIDDSALGLRLLHPRIPIPSYPWEWTPSQWLMAAELTLNLCDEALSEGWVLKDATPLNILFVGSRPVFVDILSFERRDSASSVWLAYGQYMRTFLLPLVMKRMMSWPLSLSIFKRDGYEPFELYLAIGWRQRLSRVAFWPITLPTWLEKFRTDTKPLKQSSIRGTDAEMTTHILKQGLVKLRQRTRRALPQNVSSRWSDYKNTLSHYTAEQSSMKRKWVQQVLDEFPAERVLDVGANTGEYSALAATTGAHVVALERDAVAAELLFCMSQSRGLPIQTIHADLARPTPAVGWDNSESIALLSRLEGQSDLVLMLAVIHHLILMEQIPLPSIMALCQRLTRRHLIVEWVPVEDPMFQSLMRGREDLYGSLTENNLLAACVGRFKLIHQHKLGNGRILFLFEKSE
jgi:hypothetical protein